VNSSADLRQDHEPDVLVLDMNRVPEALTGLSCDSVDEGQRVNPSTASLINLFSKNMGVRIGGFDFVGQDLDGLTPCLDRASQILRCRRQNEDALNGWSSIGQNAHSSLAFGNVHVTI
jgi:hypothetical protein